MKKRPSNARQHTHTQSNLMYRLWAGIPSPATVMFINFNRIRVRACVHLCVLSLQFQYHIHVFFSLPHFFRIFDLLVLISFEPIAVNYTTFNRFIYFNRRMCAHSILFEKEEKTHIVLMHLRNVLCYIESNAYVFKRNNHNCTTILRFKIIL